MLYENLQEQLSECLPEHQKQFVIQNYKYFIEASKENDPLYEQFLSLIDRFSIAGQKIETITKDIKALQEAKQRCADLLQQNVILDDVGEDLQSEDQLAEMLDNLAMFTYEKNYEHAIETYKLLQETLQSKKFLKLIKKPDLYKQIDSTYKNLSQQIYNDYIQQSHTQEAEQLMQYLIILNKNELLTQGYLQIQKNKFLDWIETVTQCNDKIIQQFINNLIKINSQYETLFREQLKKNQLLFSFLSQWNTQIIQQFFTKISQYIYQDVIQFDEIFNKSKQLFSIFQQYQSKGISIDFDIQQELALYIEEKLNEIFSLYGQKINQLLHFNQGRLIKIEYLQSLLDGDSLLQAQEIQNTNKPSEIKVKGSATIKNTFEQINQPVSASSAFFWNIVYKLADCALNFFNPEQFPLLSTLLNDIISKMLILFVKDYQQALKQNRKDNNSLFEIGDLYGNHNLNNTFVQYIQIRASLFSFQNKEEWKPIIEYWYQELKKQMQLYFKNTILNTLPFWICEYGKQYTQKQYNQKVSPLFLMIIYTILEQKNLFSKMIPQSPTSYFLNLLWDYIKFLLEYSFYWQYHNYGKNYDVFFLKQQNQQELGLEMNQINLCFQQGAIKINQFTLEGVQQLIYDVQLLQDCYSRYIGPLPTGDQFLQKFVTLYCKEKKCQQPSMQSPNFDNYFSNSFQKDMIQAKSYIQERKSFMV